MNILALSELRGVLVETTVPEGMQGAVHAITRLHAKKPSPPPSPAWRKSSS